MCNDLLFVASCEVSMAITSTCSQRAVLLSRKRLMFVMVITCF
jgi:hypothetical protein